MLEPLCASSISLLPYHAFPDFSHPSHAVLLLWLCVLQQCHLTWSRGPLFDTQHLQLPQVLYTLQNPSWLHGAVIQGDNTHIQLQLYSDNTPRPQHPGTVHAIKAAADTTCITVEWAGKTHMNGCSAQGQHSCELYFSCCCCRNNWDGVSLRVCLSTASAAIPLKPCQK